MRGLEKVVSVDQNALKVSYNENLPI